MTQPDWWYDDLKQVGLDFADPRQAMTYDERQGHDPSADRALLAQLGVDRSTAMADIGCGTGMLACEAAGLARSVRAIDVSQAMLDLARRRARERNHTNLTFEQASFLSFETSGDLDLIVTKNALHHLPDVWKAVALTRMRDALRPGGRIYIRDVVYNCGPDNLPLLVEGWIGLMGRETGYSRAEVATHVREEHSTFGWILERLITEAGFRLLNRSHDGVYATYLAQAVA